MKKVLIFLVAFIISSGAFAQKMTEVKTRDLPKPIEKFINDNTPGATIFKAVKVDDKGTLTYNVAIDVHGHKHILIFNQAGKFLKKGDDLVNSAKNTPVKKETERTNLPSQTYPADKSKTDTQNNPKK
jgi:Na+-transporting methylmalonyl-CoA/oxaloacetate decarboxylase gamma subunit